MTGDAQAGAGDGAPPPRAVPFGQALAWWLRLGCISFGGPAGQIALMHAELVERRHWISERRFLHALSYCMVLPGPEAQQLATYIGWLLHGVRGGVAAGLLFIAPSFLVLVALAWLYITQGDTPFVAGALYGVKPAVTALVAVAAWRVAKRALHGPALVAIAVLAFLAPSLLHLPFPLVIGCAAAAGAIGGRVAPAQFRAPAPHPAAVHAAGPAIIGDDSPLPGHARLHRRAVAGIAATGLAIWATALGALLLLGGWQADLTQMGWFFTKAALLTFGGAYAVLPYVYQAAVGHYGWLTGAQMIDGLALGETTPGPLIMIVTFVGFVGAWQAAPPATALSAALAGAAVATFFTFLPSFVFILCGGPFIEATRDDLHFTAPLTGISAAVTGVIANLALFFALHVLWPAGHDRLPDLLALGIGVAALVALVRLRLGVVTVLASAAAAGLAARLLLH